MGYIKEKKALGQIPHISDVQVVELFFQATATTVAVRWGMTAWLPGATSPSSIVWCMVISGHSSSVGDHVWESTIVTG